MSTKRFKSAFIVLFSLFFQTGRSFAVVADANIILQIRQMKANKLTELRAECSEIPILIKQCRHAKIAPDKRTKKPAYPPYNLPEPSQKSSLHRNCPELVVFKSRDEQIEKINELNDQLADLKQKISAVEANDLNVIVPIFKNSKIGQIGRFGTYSVTNGLFVTEEPQYCKIISISDETNALVDFVYYSNYVRRSPSGYGVGLPQEYSKLIWLKGVDVSNMITGSRFKPVGIFMITCTTDYLTPNHAKFTVYVFEPLVIDPNYI